RSRRWARRGCGSPPRGRASSRRGRGGAGAGTRTSPGGREGRPPTSPPPPRSLLAAASSPPFPPAGGARPSRLGPAGRAERGVRVGVGAAGLGGRSGLAGAGPEAAFAPARGGMGDELAVLDGRPPADAVAAIGGTATNLAAVKHELSTYDGDIVQGTILDRSEIDRQIELYRTRTTDERRQIVGLQPKRAEVILAGACIVRTVIDKP